VIRSQARITLIRRFQDWRAEAAVLDNARIGWRPEGRTDKQEVVMAEESSTAFEIPAEMRAFAEKSVEQAKQAFNSFISAAQHAANTAENQAQSARTGVKEVGEMAIGFTQRNVASSFEFAEKLVRAKNAQELAALHAEYVKNQIAALTEQAKELGKRAVKLTGHGAD
jgi:phasin